MTQIKVDTVTNSAGTGNPDFADGLTYEGSATSTLNLCEYTSSASEPSSPKNGALWYDTTNSVTKIYANGSWNELTAASGGGNAVWYGDRQIRFGGLTPSSSSLNVIEYFSNSSANATDFGDLTETTQGAGAASDGSRAIRASGAASTSMDYITTSTTGNATDFGDITECTYFSGIGDGTYAVFGDGDTFYYVTVQTTGNASSFSGVASSNMGGSGGAGNGTIGIFTGYDDEVIYKVTLATQSGAASHGTLSTAATIAGLVSDDTYTVAAHGGNVADNTMSYITTATGGTSSDFGDLETGVWFMGASSDHTYGYFAGGGGGTNKIQQITIATTGNASDFGDLVTAARLLTGTSGAAS